MKTSNAEGSVAVSTLEQMVVDYLRGHADFFVRHAEVLVDLEVFHPCGEAVSLIEYQVDVLRDQTRQLRRRLQDLMVTARENEQLGERVHQLTLSLVRCRGLRPVLGTLYDALREGLGAERAAVRLLFGPADPQDGGLPEFLGDDERARRVIAPLLGVTSPLCGRFPADQLAVLFGEAGETVRSAAMIPLGAEERIGVLAIGSEQDVRYRPGMGTTFLRQLAETASELLRPHLARPAPAEG